MIKFQVFQSVVLYHMWKEQYSTTQKEFMYFHFYITYQGEIIDLINPRKWEKISGKVDKPKHWKLIKK